MSSDPRQFESVNLAGAPVLVAAVVGDTPGTGRVPIGNPFAAAQAFFVSAPVGQTQATDATMFVEPAESIAAYGNDVCLDRYRRLVAYVWRTSGTASTWDTWLTLRRGTSSVTDFEIPLKQSRTFGIFNGATVLDIDLPRDWAAGIGVAGDTLRFNFEVQSTAAAVTVGCCAFLIPTISASGYPGRGAFAFPNPGGGPS